MDPRRSDSHDPHIYGQAGRLSVQKRFLFHRSGGDFSLARQRKVGAGIPGKPPAFGEKANPRKRPEGVAYSFGPFWSIRALSTQKKVNSPVASSLPFSPVMSTAVSTVDFPRCRTQAVARTTPVD